MNVKSFGIIKTAILGAVICTLCDKLHVLTGTLSYPIPFWGGQPWWTFPGFFAAFIIMGLLYVKLINVLPNSINRAYSCSHGSNRETLDALLIFTLVYLSSGFGHEYSFILTFIFFVTFLFRLIFAIDKSFILILGIILGIGGAMGEGILSAFDLVHYSMPEIFHVPVWLVGVYLHGAFALRECMRNFVYVEN